MRKSIRLALVSAVLYGTGAHWAALQGAAWAGMLATRVNESSWAEAVTSTFSGAKPCKVCHVVAKGSETEQAPTLLRPAPALDLISSVVSGLRVVLTASTPSFISLRSGNYMSSRPVVPPPKTVFPA